MKAHLKNIIICFIAAPLAAIGLYAAAGPNGADSGRVHGPDGEFGGPGARGEGRPHRGNPLMKIADSDGDGVLSGLEIEGLPAMMLTFDTNGDGALDRDEMEMAMPPPPPPRGLDDGMGGPPPHARGQGQQGTPGCPMCDPAKN